MPALVNNAISPETQHRFHTEGWSQCSGYVDQSTLDALRVGAEALTQQVGAEPRSQYYLDRFADGQTRLARIEAISDALAVVQTSGLRAQMARDAQLLLGGDVVLFKDKLNIRYPGSAGYAPHQDAARWHRFGEAFVSFGLFLSTSDATRGGFRFAQYELTQGLKASQTGDFNVSAFGDLRQQDVMVEAGDALIIDGRAPHCTTENQSPDRVLHLLFTFARSTDLGLRRSYYAAQEAAFEKVRQGNLFTFAAR